MGWDLEGDTQLTKNGGNPMWALKEGVDGLSHGIAAVQFPQTRMADTLLSSAGLSFLIYQLTLLGPLYPSAWESSLSHSVA